MALISNGINNMQAVEINEMEQNTNQNSQNDVIYVETETSFINGRLGDQSNITMEHESGTYLLNNVSEMIVNLDNSVNSVNDNVKSNTSNQHEENLIHIVPNIIENELKLEIPKAGTVVTSKDVKRAGPYVLGPLIGTSPVKSILQCLAKKNGTDKFYTIKFLALKNMDEEETQDDKQGKMLLHVEYSLLSMLKDVEGVVHHHGFFKDSALEQKLMEECLVFTGKVRKRLCLVLDCLISHDLNPRNEELLNLKHHVIKEKKLSEKETLLIFADTVKIVASFHDRNIVHRDLKLGNLVLNRRTKKVTITNFCLGKHLSREDELLTDQLGSPAYISPDVLNGKPYLGKPSDMWALGVILFTMLYGHLPFYHNNPTILFQRIKAIDYYIPTDIHVSEGTQYLIQHLLISQPFIRLTAIEVLDTLSSIIATFRVPAIIGEEEQVVPEIELLEENNDKAGRDISENINVFDKKLSEFSKQVTMQEQMCRMQEEHVPPQLPQTRLYGQIPVYRVDSDARELTPLELDKYNHLIPNENQRSTTLNNRGEANSHLNVDRNGRPIFSGQVNNRDQVMELHSQNNNSQGINNTQDQRFTNYNLNSFGIVPSNAVVSTRSEPYLANSVMSTIRSMIGIMNKRKKPLNLYRYINENNNGRVSSTDNANRQWPISRVNRQMRMMPQSQDFSLCLAAESNTDPQLIENAISAIFQQNHQMLDIIAVHNNLHPLTPNFSASRGNCFRNYYNRLLRSLKNSQIILPEALLDRLISIRERLQVYTRNMLQTIASASNVSQNSRFHRERAGSSRRLSQNRHSPYLRNT